MDRTNIQVTVEWKISTYPNTLATGPWFVRQVQLWQMQLSLDEGFIQLGKNMLLGCYLDMRVWSLLKPLLKMCAAVDIFDSDYVCLCALKNQMDTTLPPVQKLLVPSVASMSGNRSMSFRPTLTPGGGNRPLDKAPTETVRNTVLL